MCSGDLVRVRKKDGEPWQKAIVQGKDGVRSNRLILEDGSVLCRNRRHIGETFERRFHNPDTREPLELPQEQVNSPVEVAKSPRKEAVIPKSPVRSCLKPHNYSSRSVINEKGNQKAITRSGRVVKPVLDPDYLYSSK